MATYPMFAHAQSSPATVIPVVVPSQLQNTGLYDESREASSPNNGYTYQPVPAELRKQLRRLREFTAEEGEFTSALGMIVRESREKLEDCGQIAGLMVVALQPGSPAADAGLEGTRTPVALWNGLLGKSSDLIIAIDTVRVSNLVDFQDRIQQVQAGEIVYLTVVRKARRLQLRLNVR